MPKNRPLASLGSDSRKRRDWSVGDHSRHGGWLRVAYQVWAQTLREV